MNQDLIQLRNVCVQSGQKKILDNLSFTVGPGRVIGLIGHNGAGKTTLSEVLLGLRDFSGEVAVLGQDPRKNRNALLHKVSYIPDVSILPRWMTVRQLLDYVEGVHPRFVRANAVAFLDAMSVPHKAKLETLSRGMLVQVHLAVIMAIDVQLMILDEPTLGLDLTSRRLFYRELIERFCDGQRSVIITTHQISEIEAYLSDVIFLHKGRLVLQETVEHLQENYVEITLRHDAHLSDLPMPVLFTEERQGQHIAVVMADQQTDWDQWGKVRVPTLETLYLMQQTRTENCGEKQ